MIPQWALVLQCFCHINTARQKWGTTYHSNSEPTYPIYHWHIGICDHKPHFPRSLTLYPCALFYIFCHINKPFQEFKIILIFGRPPEGDSGLDDYDESQYDACSRKGLVGLLLSIWTGARERFESWACGIILPYHHIKRGERLNAFVDPQMQTWICVIWWWKVEVHNRAKNINQEIFAYLEYLRRKCVSAWYHSQHCWLKQTDLFWQHCILIRVADLSSHQYVCSAYNDNNVRES